MDDAEVAVMRANLSFKAVALPSGKHRVVFEYTTTKLRWAVGTFKLTFLLSMGYVVFYELRRRQHRADSSNV